MDIDRRPADRAWPGQALQRAGRAGAGGGWTGLSGEGFTAGCGDVSHDVSAAGGVPDRAAKGGSRRNLQFRSCPPFGTALRAGRRHGGGVINAVGTPQSLLLLGGTSDIALAIARRYAADRGLRVVLAARPSEQRDAAAADLREMGCSVEEVDLEARDPGSHAQTIEQAFAGGDIDVAVSPLACSVIPSKPGGTPTSCWSSPRSTTPLRSISEFCSPLECGCRDTGASSRCPAWRESGFADPTSSTGRLRRASTDSSLASAKRSGIMACVCWWFGRAS